MSTRCNIKIVQLDCENHTGTYAPIWLYHHHDGYPQGVGREIQLLLNGCNYITAGQVARALLCSGEPMYDGANWFEVTFGQHGDIDYLYEVFVGGITDGTHSKPLLRCWERMWDFRPIKPGRKNANGFDVATISWHFAEVPMDGITGTWEGSNK